MVLQPLEQALAFQKRARVSDDHPELDPTVVRSLDGLFHNMGAGIGQDDITVHDLPFVQQEPHNGGVRDLHTLFDEAFDFVCQLMLRLIVSPVRWDVGHHRTHVPAPAMVHGQARRHTWHSTGQKVAYRIALPVPNEWGRHFAKNATCTRSCLSKS